MTFLLAFLFAPPVIDEGNRWEQAAAVVQLGKDSRCTFYFWRRDAFGRLEVGASLCAAEIESLTWDGKTWEFRWLDESTEYDADEQPVQRSVRRVLRTPAIWTHWFFGGQSWKVPDAKNVGWGFLEVPAEKTE